MTDDRKGSISGLTASEAQEFHRLFMQGFFMFVGATAVAHVLIWFWRPWF
jgi:light-harvesting complex 1 beta chain